MDAFIAIFLFIFGFVTILIAGWYEQWEEDKKLERKIKKEKYINSKVKK